ncbi:MAG TPA: hypothetical protein VNV82_13055 [Bryobacteraceae bacterium]|nr:hypothetical protein [Bryobacteraceae bacterium]
MANTNNLLEAAGRWFLRSGIQEPGGGVARYYRSDLGKNAPVSTEITGYAVRALLFLHERTGLAEYQDAALRAARFLTRTAWDRKLETFPFEHSSNGDRSRALAYFFDCGIIVRGLLAAWHASEEPEFRDTAIAAGRAMMHDFQQGGAIHPILALPAKQPLAHEARWSASPGCYQLKSAMAWQELFEATGEMEFFRAYESAVAAALASEYDFLPGETNREKVMDRLHAYAYFLEGLSPMLHRSDCAHAFREGIGRVAAYLGEIAPLFARSDVYAQLLRARLLGEALGVIPLDHAAAAQEADQAAAFQLSAEDPRVVGGFLFGRKCGEAMPFVNPVSTAFCVQALAWWDDRKNNTLQARRQLLI